MSRGSGWIALAIFVLSCAALFGPPLRDGVTRVVPSKRVEPRMQALVRSDHQWVVWAVARNARTLATRPHRLFDAEQCFPDEGTLSLGEPVIALALLGVPAWLLTQDPIGTYNAALVLHTLVAALAMYWLVASWSGRSSAGIVAGLLYAFAGVGVRDIMHPYAADTTGMVLALLFAERLFSRGRWRDAAGLSAAGSYQLATSFYPLIASSLLAVPVAVFLLVRIRPRKVRLAQLAAVAGVVATAAILLLGPYLSRSAAGAFEHETPPHFLSWLGALMSSSGLGLALAAAGLGVPRARELEGPRPGIRWSLVVGALLVAIVAAGPNAPVDLYGSLAAFVPGLDAVRLPHKISSGIHLAVSVLAGLGFARLLGLLERRRPSLLRPAAAAGVLGCAAAVGAALPEYTALAVRPPADRIEFYEQLGEAGNVGPIYETPIPSVGGRFVWSGTSADVLLAEFHRRRTSACYTSHPQPHRAILEKIDRSLPAVSAVRELARLGFTTVVVHHAQGRNAPKVRAFEGAAARRGSQLRRLRTSGDRSAYAIEVGAPR